MQSNCGPRSRTSSIFHLRNSQSDPLIPGLLDDISCDQLDRINELRRQEGRHPAPFHLYSMQGKSTFNFILKDFEELIEILQKRTN